MQWYFTLILVYIFRRMLVLTLSPANRCHIFGVTKLSFDGYFKQFLSLFTSLTATLFLRFSIVLPHTTFFINLERFSHYCHYCFLLLFFFSYMLNSKLGFSNTDQILIHYALSLFLILVLNKVAKFRTEARSFLCQRSFFFV